MERQNLQNHVRSLITLPVNDSPTRKNVSGDSIRTQSRCSANSCPPAVTRTLSWRGIHPLLRGSSESCPNGSGRNWSTRFPCLLSYRLPGDCT